MSWMEEEADPWATDDAPGGGEGGGGEGGEAVAEAGATPKKAAAAPSGEAKYDWRAANLPKAPLPEYTLHWVRPLYLNYGYIMDYRKNYYNDVLDWMDKRNAGIAREEPRAQEWAERVMRTYDKKNIDKSHKRASDMGILVSYKPLPRHYSYHTRAYYSLKYQKIL